MGDIQEYPQVNQTFPELTPMYPMNKNSKSRHYRWYDPRGNTAVGFVVSGPADPGAPVSGGGGVVTGKMLGSFLYTRTDTPGTNGKVGGYINRDLILGYPSGSHEPRYEYQSNGGSGLLLESGAINKLYNTGNWSTQGTFGWTANQMTGLGTLAATGPDGTTSAVVLTTTAASGHVHQARGAVGVGTRYFTVWLRTPTGAGSTTADITLNNFSTHTTVTVTETWQRFYITMASGAVTAGIRIQGQGNVIHAYGPVLTVNSQMKSEAINDNTDAAYGVDNLSGSFLGLTGGMFVVLDIYRRSRTSTFASPAIQIDMTGNGTTLFTGLSLVDSAPGNLYYYTDDGIDYNEYSESMWWTNRIKLAVALGPTSMRVAYTGMAGAPLVTANYLNFPNTGNIGVDILGNQVLLNSAIIYPYLPSDDLLKSHVHIEDFVSGEPEGPE